MARNITSFRNLSDLRFANIIKLDRMKVIRLVPCILSSIQCCLAHMASSSMLSGRHGISSSTSTGGSIESLGRYEYYLRARCGGYCVPFCEEYLRHRLNITLHDFDLSHYLPRPLRASFGNGTRLEPITQHKTVPTGRIMCLGVFCCSSCQLTRIA